jgi:hypothetical protein
MEDVLKNPGITIGTTTLYSRAARQRLQEEEYHLLPPPIPFISANAARKIVQCMLSTHRDRMLVTA